MAKPAISVQMASVATPTLSVVSPFKLVMSSERMLVRMPAALFFLSNHHIYLWSKLSKNSVRTWYVRFSPVTEKISFWQKLQKPIIKQRLRKYVIVRFLSSMNFGESFPSMITKVISQIKYPNNGIPAPQHMHTRI